MIYPDFSRYATGYWILDKITAPVWWVYDKWSEWRLFRVIGDGDVVRGRRLFRQAVRESAIDDLIRRGLEDAEQ